MDIKIISATPTDVEQIEAKNEESLPQQVLDGATPEMINTIAVKQTLEIDRDNTDYDEDVETLVRWAKEQTDSDDPQEIKWAIRDLRMRLGTPSYGDSIKHLSRFAYLDSEEKRIKREKREFI